LGIVLFFFLQARAKEFLKGPQGCNAIYVHLLMVYIEALPSRNIMAS
jgi:hypothetical protein